MDVEVAGNFTLIFLLKFLNISVHISCSIELITLIWVSLGGSLHVPPAEVEYRWAMPILIKGDDVRSGTKAKARYGQLRTAWDLMG